MSDKHVHYSFIGFEVTIYLDSSKFNGLLVEVFWSLGGLFKWFCDTRIWSFQRVM